MSRRRMNSPLLVLVLFVVLALPAGIAVMSVDSGANFADNERFSGNRLGAGSVDVAIDDVIEVTDASARQVRSSDPTVFSATNLAPGDRVTGALSVNNDGTLPLRFWVTAKATSSSGDLGDWLLFDGWVAADCGRGLDGADQVFNTNVALNSQHARLIGDSTGVEQELRLEPGDDLVVCVGAHLPLAAPNEVQSARVEVELIVAAEHAVNTETVEDGE